MTDSLIFHLPDLGEGLTEAVLVSWSVAVGDEVSVDQTIAEVETAKSIVELPSPYAGTVSRLYGAVGETILTGAPFLAVGGPASDLESASAGATTSPEHESYREEEQAGSGNVLIGYGTGAGPVKGRRRRRAAPQTTKTSFDDAEAALTAQANQSPAAPEGPSPTVAVRSPIVRRLARDLGVDPRNVVPTGVDGAVTRADVLGAATVNSPEPVSLPPSESPRCPAPSPARQLQVARVEPFSPMRKAISTKLSRSRAEIPEATVWVDVDITDLWTMRPQMAPAGSVVPSFTALLARFTLLALQEYPLLAARLNDSVDSITVFDGVNLGVAINTERGLMVPVIERADTLSLAQIDTALRELAEDSRGGKVAAPPKLGSTFTLNNYGSFGVDGSAAIINYPEVAILGVGRALERPWVVDGAIVARRIVQLSLVFDHRVCDGGYAAGFLRAIVDLLERPLSAYSRV